MFSAVAAPSPYRLKDKAKRLGYPLHSHRLHVGHVGRLAETHREALLLESVGPEALPVLGRVLARRIEEALP